MALVARSAVNDRADQEGPVGHQIGIVQRGVELLLTVAIQLVTTSAIVGECHSTQGNLVSDVLLGRRRCRNVGGKSRCKRHCKSRRQR